LVVRANMWSWTDLVWKTTHKYLVSKCIIVYHPSRREKFHERAFIAPVKLTDEMGG
jgi:hypothetical protein